MNSTISVHKLTGKYSFDVACFTNRGGREKNEDSVLCTQMQHKSDILLCAIADGLGAHGGGDIASKTATEKAAEAVIKAKHLSRRLVAQIYDKMNEAVAAQQTAEVRMKTTFAGVFIQGRKGIASNIGDTRIYRFSNGVQTGITADHTASYNAVMSEGGTLEDIRKHPMRHILNAAVGADVPRNPDLYPHKIEPGLAYLICSDGFWEFVNEAEMQDALNTSDCSEQWLKRMLDIHDKKADLWHDNYSAVCIRVGYV